MSCTWRLISVCFSGRFRKDDETLTIYNVNPEDAGTYTCTARTEIDEKSASARLTVTGTHTFTYILQYIEIK